ncbi:MAG: GNAT family N-acetyltransferase [Actinomycetota bacterium]
MVAVLIADELDHAGQVVLGADFVQGEWSRVGDLTTDAWVAVDGAGVIVGYAQVTLDEPDLTQSWGVVHPEHRGRGIGTSLLDRIEERAPELVATPSSLRFHHAINAGDDAAAAMLRSRGLHPVHHFWHMQIDLVEPFEPGRSPEGIEIDGLEPDQDLAAIHALLDEAFRDDRSHHPAPFDRWVEEETSTPGYDRTLWLLALEAEVPVGVLTASAGEDHGWVDYLAVSASHRGHGIGPALLRRSFAMFWERDIRRVLVSVDAQNPTGATGVYERVGMRIVNAWDEWERPPAATQTSEV